MKLLANLKKRSLKEEIDFFKINKKFGANIIDQF